MSPTLRGVLKIRVLILDMETSPKTVLHFGRLWDTSIQPSNIVEPSRMMCFAAKWLGEKKVYFYSEFHNTREEMLQALHDLLHEADILITYNGKRFDVPHANREMLEGGLKPPSPYRNIDLDETMKRAFLFESHSLDFVSTRLGIGSKIAHAGMVLWRQCMAGDATAWAKMKKYNIGDVKLTEKLYETVRPWIKIHPSVAFDANGEKMVCPACASENLVREGFAFTAVGKFQRYSCSDCGKWSRATSRVNTGGTGITEVAS